ncbi:hypothetical protein FHS18_000298 [Paenibacillus phyllosphaerae]|uniref:Sporulation protein n=1 Tax=Paenibacillus phyllosphaerae TaxID=274593 RepID=A0A7W5AT29_9BACL|nr:YtrH family sporulation protein [Paenibacillus phyllosphaerae]MBB3108270.1 hypothetical protein [Paenibacillus phyllosphaerae]
MYNTVLAFAIIDFFTAFGLVFGGSILAGIGAVFVFMPPSTLMLKTATQLKIWAIVAAVGGSIDPIRVIESNFLDGHMSPVAQQIGYIVCAFLGAHIGTELIRWLCRGAA